MKALQTVWPRLTLASTAASGQASVTRLIVASSSSQIKAFSTNADIVDLEREFDRDEAVVDKSSVWQEEAPPPYTSLETDLDRDDPEMVDKSSLFSAPEFVPPPPVDINAEMDLMDDGTDNAAASKEAAA